MESQLSQLTSTGTLSLTQIVFTNLKQMKMAGPLTHTHTYPSPVRCSTVSALECGVETNKNRALHSRTSNSNTVIPWNFGVVRSPPRSRPSNSNANPALRGPLVRPHGHANPAWVRHVHSSSLARRFLCSPSSKNKSGTVSISQFGYRWCPTILGN